MNFQRPHCESPFRGCASRVSAPPFWSRFIGGVELRPVFAVGLP